MQYHTVTHTHTHTLLTHHNCRYTQNPYQTKTCAQSIKISIFYNIRLPLLFLSSLAPFHTNIFQPHRVDPHKVPVCLSFQLLSTTWKHQPILKSSLFWFFFKVTFSTSTILFYLLDYFNILDVLHAPFNSAPSLQNTSSFYS